ncbi:transcription regulator HTH, apses-type DNA-binding domain-containing protein [Phlyctochytrium arcticum]|nr:transcription regulator HTH, apses-type DNA-binding domain-containing protein [Phlyctochytrium arcticum]
MRGPSQVRNLHLATPYSRRNGEKAEEVPARRRSTGGAIVMQGRVGDNVAAREVSLNGVPIYRRRSDGWINLSHICKAVGMQKGQRSRIINKETRECAHQKVQGGAAAFQGTWIPQYKAKQFVVAQGVYDSVRDLFDSTPPPQHTLHLV